MSDDYEDDLDSTEDDSKPVPGWRKKLERDAENGRKAAQDAQKELAFYKAGLPMEDPRMSYFVKGYEGEFSADAIRKAATDAGFMQASSADTAVADQVQGLARISEASAGATSNTSLNQAEILAEALKAANNAPPHLAAQTYAAVLQTHGVTRMSNPS